MRAPALPLGLGMAGALPGWVWLAGGAAVLLVLLKPGLVAQKLIEAGADGAAAALTGAAKGAGNVAMKYGTPGVAVKSGDYLATTGAGTAARRWVGLADLNSPESMRLCALAQKNGDDMMAAKYCAPSAWFGGLFDGK